MARLFSGLYLSDPGRIDGFGADAASFIKFLTAVMGSVMAGWGTAILCVLALRFRPGNPEAWWAVALSVLVWFIPDTAYSLLAGFWQNALLNTTALVLFVVPLAVTYRACGRAWCASNPGVNPTTPCEADSGRERA